MKLYVAGPMTGLPDFNYPAFERAEMLLRGAGYEVESPHHNGDGDTSKPWQWYVRAALAQMLRCDGVALLPGWEKSRGANLEHFIACTLDMPCRDVVSWLLLTPVPAPAGAVQ